MYTEEIAFFKHLLRLEEVPIRFEWFHRVAVEKRNGRETWGMHWIYGDGTHLVQVASRAYGYNFVLDTIAHELRHAWQHHTGILRQEERYWIWEGSNYAPDPARYHVKRSEYKTRPHEIDARAFASEAVFALVEETGKGQRLEPLPTVTKSVASLFY